MSEEKIIEKLNEHDKKFDKIESVLEQHTQVLDQHAKKIDEHGIKIDRIEAVLEKHTEKFIEHDARFDRIEATISEFRGEVLQGQDEMMTVLKRMDQERVFTTERVKRLENDVEINTLDIKQIKDQLNIA